jgi:hypothetical protein
MKNTADVTGGKPIAVLLQSISGVSAINPLVAFYDIHGGKTYFIIIKSLQSTAGHRPLQFLAISLDPRLFASTYLEIYLFVHIK